MDTIRFQEQVDRIRRVTATRTQGELANFLGISLSAFSHAEERSKIPSGWLILLLRVKNVNPEWVLTGKGPCFIASPSGAGRYETGAAMAERKDDEDALGRLSSRALADELVRRIAVSQAKTLCFDDDE